MADETKPDMPPQFQVLRQDLTENLRFMKRQQWTITNYLILLFAAVYVFHNDFTVPTLCERLILTILTGLALAVGPILLVAIQWDMRRYRTDLEYMDQEYFTDEQRRKLHMGPASGQEYRNFGVLFLISLIAVVVAGGALVMWSIWL